MAKGFREFLSADGKGMKLALVILLGLTLILIGSFGSSSALKESEKSTEERLAETCSMMEGVGECHVTLSYSSDDKVYAVLVLCEGAESPQVRERITDVFRSLYGIGSNRVEIQKLNK
ncbi:MAG: hypothetical protein IJX58_04270 [Clostridia bacterium]|nr:hypothetical protein [Clostridia bacterium]